MENGPKIEQTWKIHKQPEKTVEVVKELDEALKSQDLDSVQKILKDPETLRSLVVRRGEKNANLDLFEKGVDFLVKEKFGPDENITSVEGKDLINLVKELKLPEQILNELANVAYHKKDHTLFFKMLEDIFKNQESFINKEVFTRATHDLATWASSVEKNPQKAIEINKKLLGSTREFEQEILEKKARFGLSFDKNIKPKEKAEDFEKISADMATLEDDYDSRRAEVEAAKAYLELAKNQEGNLRFNNLDKAKELSLEALKYSLDIGYPNLEIHARETLGKIYDEMGDKRKAESYGKKSKELREKYDYNK